MKINIFVITNIYSLFTNKDQVNSITKLMSKGNHNFIIYDFFESNYEPDQLILKKIIDNNYLDKFIETNKPKDLTSIFTLIIKILFLKDSFNLYIDSCTTIIQQLFIMIFKFKKSKIFGLCFNFPYTFQKINNEDD